MSSSQQDEGLSQGINPSLTQRKEQNGNPTTDTPDGRKTSSNPPARMYETNKSRRNNPHMTGYTLNGYKATLCRCANPESHGDAFTPHRSYPTARDVNGRRIPTWIEAVHRILDTIGKDSATRDEELAVFHLVHGVEKADIARFKHRQVAAYVEQEGDQYYLEDTVTWYGNVNPKGFVIIPDWLRGDSPETICRWLERERRQAAQEGGRS
jgi:hypothetical protein